MIIFTSLLEAMATNVTCIACDTCDACGEDSFVRPELEVENGNVPSSRSILLTIDVHLVTVVIKSGFFYADRSGYMDISSIEKSCT